jgi:ABC-type branched-subunit amino acid transport system ATPase component
MQIHLKLSGYRCFPPDKPACIVFREGMTALIGLNNTGKSALLRSIYELRDLFLRLSANSNQLQTAMMHETDFQPVEEIGDYEDIFWHFSSEDALIEISLPEYENDTCVFWKATIRLLRGKKPRFRFIIHDFNGTPIPCKRGVMPAPRISVEEPDIGERAILIDGVRGDPQRLFSAFLLLSNCFYCPSTRHATPFSPDSRPRSLFDIQVGKPFIDDWQLHQQGSGKASTETIDRIVKDIQRLFRYERLQIHVAMGARELLVVANGKSLPLSNLGSGLSQFIVLLGNIAFRNPSWILVDEPELNLHPALQLDFLQAVAARATEGVVFATHSLGLARQVAEQIYTFSQSLGKTSVNPIEQTSDLAQIIGEMSFGRGDFSARKVLLVEGQLDVLAFEALLSMVNKEHEFAILSLGGKNCINSKRKSELEHIAALNLHVSAVIDSEKHSSTSGLEKHRKDFQRMCERLGISCHILDRRAIENYFTQRAIHAALGKDHHRALKPYEALASLPHHWRKRDNWKIVRAMRWEEIKETDIGIWLKTLR